jgi:hypothetical protein
MIIIMRLAGLGLSRPHLLWYCNPDGDLTFRYIIKTTETWLGIDTGTVTYTPTSISISKTGGHSKEAKLAVTNLGDVVLYGAGGDVLWVLDKSTSAP